MEEIKACHSLGDVGYRQIGSWGWQLKQTAMEIPRGWCEKLGVKNSEDAFHALLQQPLPGNLE